MSANTATPDATSSNQSRPRAILSRAALPDGTVPSEIETLAHQVMLRYTVDAIEPPRLNPSAEIQERRRSLGRKLFPKTRAQIAQVLQTIQSPAPVVQYRLGEIDSQADRDVREQLKAKGIDGILIATADPDAAVALYNEAGMEEVRMRLDEAPHTGYGNLECDDARPDEPPDYISPW